MNDYQPAGSTPLRIEDITPDQRFVLTVAGDPPEAYSGTFTSAPFAAASWGPDNQAVTVLWDGQTESTMVFFHELGLSADPTTGEIDPRVGLFRGGDGDDEVNNLIVLGEN